MSLLALIGLAVVVVLAAVLLQRAEFRSVFKRRPVPPDKDGPAP